mgnify:FL=1
MEFLGLQYRKMIKEASQQKTNMIIYNIAKKGFEEENSKDLMDFFSTINFKDMNISQTQYIKNLKSLEQLIFIENDPVGYIDGIVTLKKCYAQVGLKISTNVLVKSFSKVVLDREKNIEGYKLWMQEAYLRKAITKAQYNRLVSNTNRERLERMM